MLLFVEHNPIVFLPHSKAETVVGVVVFLLENIGYLEEVSFLSFAHLLRAFK